MKVKPNKGSVGFYATFIVNVDVFSLICSRVPPGVRCTFLRDSGHRSLWESSIPTSRFPPIPYPVRACEPGTLHLDEEQIKGAKVVDCPPAVPGGLSSMFYEFFMLNPRLYTYCFRFLEPSLSKLLYVFLTIWD